MFGGLKSKLTGSARKFSGQTDFLEAVCAASALIVYADGSADDSEIEAALKAAKSNPGLAGNFKDSDIERAMDGMLTRARGGRSGRAGLYKEIADISADNDKAEAVLLAALDVADEGGIGDQEKTALNEIANRLSLGEFLKKQLAV